MSAKTFLDTNILIYAFASNSKKGELAEGLLAAGGVISVQVLNEFASVSRRKLGMQWKDIEARISVVTSLLDAPVATTLDTHLAACTLARKHQFSFYDALIVAAAIETGCDTLFSEDFQHGRSIGGLTVRNPFA